MSYHNTRCRPIFRFALLIATTLIAGQSNADRIQKPVPGAAYAIYYDDTNVGTRGLYGEVLSWNPRDDRDYGVLVDIQEDKTADVACAPKKMVCRFYQSGPAGAEIQGYTCLKDCTSAEPKKTFPPTTPPDQGPTCSVAGLYQPWCDIQRVGIEAKWAVYFDANGDPLFAEGLKGARARIIEGPMTWNGNVSCSPPKPYYCSMGGSSWCSAFPCR
jgi:hypothetical protein